MKDIWHRLGRLVLEKLFPKFHNRIALIVIGLGAALLAPPLVERLLNAVLSTSFNFTIIDKNDPVYGIILIAMALAYNAFCLWVLEHTSPKSQSIADSDAHNSRIHDIQLFERIDKLFPEDVILWFQEDLSPPCIMDGQRAQTCDQLMYFNMKVGNRFLDDTIQEAFNNFCAAVTKLNSWCSHNFFPINGDRYKLYPELYDRAELGDQEANHKLDECHNTIRALVHEATAAYKRFRSDVKSKLKK